LTRTAPIVAQSDLTLCQAVNDAGTLSATGESHTRLSLTYSLPIVK
jgi:hypothetical protein